MTHAAHPRAARDADYPCGVETSGLIARQGQCAFEGGQGLCTETGFLEFHHVVPYAAGGDTAVANIELRCRADNHYEADHFFGSSPPLCVREQRHRYGMSIYNSVRTELALLAVLQHCPRG